MLASGADDSLVCVWDLFNTSNGAQIDVVQSDTLASNNGAPPSGLLPQQQPVQTQQVAPASGAAAGPGGAAAPAAGEKAAQAPQAKGPAASWKCDYEIANLSWAPQSGLTGQGGEWVGVCGGRGIWGVKL